MFRVRDKETTTKPQEKRKQAATFHSREHLQLPPDCLPDCSPGMLRSCRNAHMRKGACTFLEQSAGSRWENTFPLTRATHTRRKSRRATNHGDFLPRPRSSAEQRTGRCRLSLKNVCLVSVLKRCVSRQTSAGCRVRAGRRGRASGVAEPRRCGIQIGRQLKFERDRRG